MVISSASNSRVKPLSGRAHGTPTFLTPQLSQRTRGTRALQVGLVLEEVEVPPGHSARYRRPGSRAAPQTRTGKAAARRRSRSRYRAGAPRGRSRCGVTVHGGVRPNASCSRLVSRMAVPPRSPDLPEPGAVLAAVKHAARRAAAVACGHP